MLEIFLERGKIMPIASIFSFSNNVSKKHFPRELQKSLLCGKKMTQGAIPVFFPVNPQGLFSLKLICFLSGKGFVKKKRGERIDSYYPAFVYLFGVYFTPSVILRHFPAVYCGAA